MTNRHPLLGSVIDFQQSSYPLAALFLERVQAALPAAAGLEDLSLLHEVMAPREISQVYDALYALARENSFRELYHGLIREHIAPHFAAPFRIQRVPGIRIHTPDSRTVQYHSDYWYGHGPEVLNFWMPLTRSFGTNALCVATLEDSLRELDTIVERRLRQPEIDERLRAICKPVELEFGNILVFNAQTAHGTLQNETGRTRVSLDFRLLMEGSDPGTKDPMDYYENAARPDAGPSPGGVSATPLVVVSYVFSKHGFTRHVPTASQRAVVRAYAEHHHLRIVAEETESYPMSHHPTLLNLADGKGTENVQGVLLFSVLCLPRDRTIRAEIYATARRTGTKLFFANEHLSFPDKANTQELEAALDRVQQI